MDVIPAGFIIASENDDSIVSSTSNSLPFGSRINTSTPIKQNKLFSSTTRAPHTPGAPENCKSNGPNERGYENSRLPLLTRLAGSHVNYDFVSHYGNVNFPSNTRKNSVGVVGALLDQRLLPLLITFAVVIIAYKMVIVTVPYAKTDSLFEVSTYAQLKFQEALRWANEKELCSTLSPLLCGLVVAIFSISMVYLDSAVPGVSPPSPFSPRSKYIYVQQKRSSIHLGYMTALAAGVVVGALMYIDF